ncbi:hypothetical protein CPC08DRAFT_52189 [Agrocybe pediades]|nr:hypothetical protein CPC08DRAFT_52189 [Agrocybe pediades]
MASTMSASKTQTPLLLRASMSTIEVKGPIDMFKSRYKYLVRVNQDGQKILEGTGASLSQETGEFRIKWDINKELLFALPSTIKLSVHGKGLRGHDLGEFEEGKDTSLMLRITISQLDTRTHTTDYVKEVMTKVDGELAAMGTLSLPNRDNVGVKFVMGQILQSTKNIMDKVADAHPFLKVAWSALAFVYEAVEKATLEDKAVHDLAKRHYRCYS